MPQHAYAGERRHADYPNVRQVQHIEKSSTKCSRYDDLKSPRSTPSFDGHSFVMKV